MENIQSAKAASVLFHNGNIRWYKLWIEHNSYHHRISIPLLHLPDRAEKSSILVPGAVFFLFLFTSYDACDNS